MNRVENWIYWGGYPAEKDNPGDWLLAAAVCCWLCDGKFRRCSCQASSSMAARLLFLLLGRDTLLGRSNGNPKVDQCPLLLHVRT